MLPPRLVVAGVLLMAAGRVDAQLAVNSPFLPPAANGTATPTQNAPLEFRGLIETPEGIRYRIYDPAKKGGVWVKLNERSPEFGVVVKQYDGNRNTLVVEHEGRTLTLEERKAKIVSSGPSSQVMAPPMQMQGPGNNMSPAVTQSVVPNPTPAEEQKRLEAVAAEVARRRALREQASTQLNQGVAPQVTMPQVAPRAAPPVPQNAPPGGRQNSNNRQQP